MNVISSQSKRNLNCWSVVTIAQGNILLNLIILTLLVIAQPILSVFIINMCVYNIAKLKRNLLLSRCLAKLAVCVDNNLILRLLCHNERRKRNTNCICMSVCVYAYTYTYIANQ
jgi:hypothetical protein